MLSFPKIVSFLFCCVFVISYFFSVFLICDIFQLRSFLFVNFLVLLSKIIFKILHVFAGFYFYNLKFLKILIFIEIALFFLRIQHQLFILFQFNFRLENLKQLVDQHPEILLCIFHNNPLQNFLKHIFRNNFPHLVFFVL